MTPSPHADTDPARTLPWRVAFWFEATMMVVGLLLVAVYSLRLATGGAPSSVGTVAKYAVIAAFMGLLAFAHRDKR